MSSQPAHWGAWMVPHLSDGEDMRLRVIEFDLRRSVKDEPEVVAALAGQLARQNAQLQAVVRAAAGRMLELEVRLAALDPTPVDPLEPFVAMARSILPPAAPTESGSQDQAP